MSERIAIVASFAIYDGRLHLGEVAELANGQFGAFDTEGRRLGSYDKRQDAERVVLELVSRGGRR